MIDPRLENVRMLSELRDRVLQKNRIAFGLRLSAIDRGADQANEATVAILERYESHFADLEKEVTLDIGRLMKDASQEMAIIHDVLALKGIGAVLAAKVLSYIDIERSDTVSALWRYAGYAVIDGERERYKKGEKAHFNRHLKIACRLVGESFLKAKSPYAQVYYDARDYYAENRPDWTKGHCHNAALRKMVKLWLAHLWNRWRAYEGLPIRPPYVEEKMGHTHITKPEDFGWATLTE